MVLPLLPVEFEQLFVISLREDRNEYEGDNHGAGKTGPG